MTKRINKINFECSLSCSSSILESNRNLFLGEGIVDFNSGNLTDRVDIFFSISSRNSNTCAEMEIVSTATESIDSVIVSLASF